MTLKAFKTLGDLVRCRSLSFSLSESLPLNHALSFIFYSLSCLRPTWVPPGACTSAHLPLGRLYLCRYECVHVRVTPPSGSCLNVKYDMHISGQRIFSICSLVLLPPPPPPSLNRDIWRKRKDISQTNSPEGRPLLGFRVNQAFQWVPKERGGQIIESRGSRLEHEALRRLRTCNISVSSPLKLIYLY